MADDAGRNDGIRYRALLNVSAALGSEGDLRASLHSVSDLLSKVVKFDSIALLLIGNSPETATLYALAPRPPKGSFDIGSEFPLVKSSAVALAMEQRQPVFVADVQAELAKFPPSFAQSFPDKRLSVLYIFPVSTPQECLGALVFGAIGREEYSSEDVELMASVALHMSAVLGGARALESAASYRRDLEHERDRLKLLLEINNHTIAHLEINALLKAASSSIRKFFDVALTGFWVVDEKSRQFQCMSLDFPGGQTHLENEVAPLLTEEAIANIRARVVHTWGPAQIHGLPDDLSELFSHESIVCLAVLPMMGSTAPLGFLLLGSRQENAISQTDLTLLAQAANQISLALENALAYGRVTFSRDRLQDEKLYLESEIQSQYAFEEIVGKSKALRNVLEQVSIVAPTDSNVLLMGETGTGKELIARAIHNLSPRRQRTFVRLNCAAVPLGLMESELFGHEKGAFTGALMQKRGRVELAEDGSLFLDEIGDIDLEIQPKLLRVLQEREFERLGSNRTIKVNLRLVAATHRDLPAMVRKGEFREDLFYRINVFPIHIPPLRERKEDIPLLVHYFVAALSRKMRKSIRMIPHEVMEAILKWPWPGNVRELQNYIERSVILSRDEVLSAPISELSLRGTDIAPGASPEFATEATLHGVERRTILNALRSSHGKLSGPGGAAERLGLKRTTLQRKIERLHIVKADYS